MMTLVGDQSPRVLVVDDNDEVRKNWVRLLGRRVEVLEAVSLKEGERLYKANPDIVLVVLDACVPGDTPNAMGLADLIRKSFAGPIIAASNCSRYRQMLVNAGCTHQEEKFNVPAAICKLLGV